MKFSLIQKFNAYREVAAARSRGEIQSKPCEICGDKAQGHHEDYSKPLELTWLCRFHHGLRHREINKPTPSNLRPHKFTIILQHGERVPSDKRPEVLNGGVAGYIEHVAPFDSFDLNLYTR